MYTWSSVLGGPGWIFLHTFLPHTVMFATPNDIAKWMYRSDSVTHLSNRENLITKCLIYKGIPTCYLRKNNWVVKWENLGRYKRHMQVSKALGCFFKGNKRNKTRLQTESSVTCMSRERRVWPRQCWWLSIAYQTFPVACSATVKEKENQVKKNTNQIWACSFKADTDDAHPPGPPHAVANSTDNDRMLTNTWLKPVPWMWKTVMYSYSIAPSIFLTTAQSHNQMSSLSSCLHLQVCARAHTQVIN